jgi:serine protease Do
MEKKMRSNKVITIMSLTVILSLTACSGLFQVGIPTPAPEIVEEQSDANVPTEVEAAPQVPSAPADLESIQAAYEHVYEQVLPSVVSITVLRTIPGSSLIRPGIPFDDGNDQDVPDFQQPGAGSGFVWDKEGHIITNNHVVEDADVIRVRFSDGSIALGELLGTDPASDLAVVQVEVDEERLKPIKTADSTAVKIGQIAIAIGNPFLLDGSMTTGIISGIGRSLDLPETIEGTGFTIPDIIQTDAPINPGNSGGVLVDISGRLIGVTTAIVSPIRANAGIGYAVPSIIVNKIVPFLIKDGKYQQPWIGMQGSTLTPELAEAMDKSADTMGVLVGAVTPGSPAETARLQGSEKEVEIYGSKAFVGGDIITAIDDQPVKDFEDLVAYLARYTNVGTEITITVLRGEETLNLKLTLASRPVQEIQLAGSEEDISSGAWLGITGTDLTRDIAKAMDLDQDLKGVLVQQVIADSPADLAGIRASSESFDAAGNESILIGGDVILNVNDEQVDGMPMLKRILNGSEPGDEIKISLLRDGVELEIAVTLGQLPS